MTRRRVQYWTVRAYNARNQLLLEQISLTLDHAQKFAAGLMRRGVYGKPVSSTTIFDRDNRPVIQK